MKSFYIYFSLEPSWPENSAEENWEKKHHVHLQRHLCTFFVWIVIIHEKCSILGACHFNAQPLSSYALSSCRSLFSTNGLRIRVPYFRFRRAVMPLSFSELFGDLRVAGRLYLALSLQLAGSTHCIRPELKAWEDETAGEKTSTGEIQDNALWSDWHCVSAWSRDVYRSRAAEMISARELWWRQL